VSAGKRVLIVDDDGSIREALVDVLAKEGFELDQAENGRKALQLLRDQAAGSSGRPILRILSYRASR
jgi:DNA-binding response OmpR family regulator